MHACVQADGSMIGLSLHMSLHPERSFCVQAFCALLSQFVWQFSTHCSSGRSCWTGSVGCTSTSVFTSSFTGSITASTGTSLTSCDVGFVKTSCTAGAQLMRNINAITIGFMYLCLLRRYLFVVVPKDLYMMKI